MIYGAAKFLYTMDIRNEIPMAERRAIYEVSRPNYFRVRKGYRIPLQIYVRTQ